MGGYRDVNALGFAYGVTVSLAFLVTSFLYSFVIYYNFKRNVIFSILFLVSFGIIDANFLAANLTKFVTGGWFSVALTLIITSILLIWRFGRHRMVEEQKKLNHPMSDLFAPRVEKDDTGTVTQVIEAVDVTTPLVIVFSSNLESVPAAFYHFTRRMPMRPRNVVFVNISAVNVAFVEQEFKLTTVPELRRVYRLLINHGYAERPPSAKRIAAFLIRELDCALDNVRYFPPPSDSELFRYIDPTFVVGRDRVVAKPGTNLFHILLVDCFQVLLFFSKPGSAALNIPPINTLEVGLQIAI